MKLDDVNATDDAALQRWAEDPAGWPAPTRTLSGEQAAEFSQRLFTAAGVDIAAVERTVGRPRVGRAENAPKGVRSPRVNVAISQRTDELLHEIGDRRGISRSQLVREALDNYLAQTG